MGWNFKNEIFEIFEISTLELVKNEYSTHTVNFGIRSVFAKGQSYAFSGGPVLGLSPLYQLSHHQKYFIEEVFLINFAIFTGKTPV